jgi:hypothetical protein
MRSLLISRQCGRESEEKAREAFDKFRLKYQGKSAYPASHCGVGSWLVNDSGSSSLPVELEDNSEQLHPIALLPFSTHDPIDAACEICLRAGRSA